MQIERLRLKNFRCYDELDIDFEPRLTVIVGENGKGKTAIFDALAIALEPYLRSFDASGRQITPQDVRLCLFIKRICVILMVWNAIIR